MPPDPIAILRRLAGVLDPRSGLAVARTGAVTPRRAVAAWLSSPWLVGRGASLGLASQINALSEPGRAAVHDRDGTLTWRELDERSTRLARVLAARGLGPGDVVATLLRNGREAVESVVAAQKLGVTLAPLNTWGREAEIAALLERLRPAVLVADPRHARPLASSIPRGTALILTGRPYEALLATEPALPLFPVALPRRHARVVIHTSGTSGRPKAAARSPRSSGPAAIAGLLQAVPLRRDDVILCPAPLFHSFGLLTLSLGTALGAEFVLPDRFDPAETLRLIDRHRATAAALVPVMIRRILDLPRARRTPKPTGMRALLVSGSAMPPELRAQAMGLFGEVLYDLYGSTEGGWVAVATPEDIRADPRTTGRPVRGAEVAVFDDEGRRLPPGEHGTLHVRSDVLFEGYRSGERAEERDGFLSMGDVGWVDAHGRVFVEGRADDMVVVGGENVYPREVESVIEQVPGVREVAVVGIPDRQYGEALAAFVEGSADPAEIERRCRRDLASFKVPRAVRLVDALPRNATGKVLKRDLPRLLEDGGGSAKRTA